MKVKRKLTLEDFEAMEALEKNYYGTDYITPSEEAYRWYCHNPRTVVVVEDQGKIAGFMNLFPVKDHVYQEILAGTLCDNMLTHHGIYSYIEMVQLVGVPTNLFLSCVVVDHQYRRGPVLGMLLKEYVKFYSLLKRRGIPFQNVVTDNVTPGGVHFSKELGLKKWKDSDHGSQIFVGTFEDFIQGANKRVK